MKVITRNGSGAESGFPKQNQGAVAATWLIIDAEQMEGVERQGR